MATYLIIDKKTREVKRRSDTPFNKDESQQPTNILSVDKSDPDNPVNVEGPELVQLKLVRDNTIPAYDPKTEKLEKDTKDDDAKGTRTIFIKAVPMTAEEQADKAAFDADEKEGKALKKLRKSIKNGTGTAEQRMKRMERAVLWLLRNGNDN